jgi:predicted naringenin-chalcone synthase
MASQFVAADPGAVVLVVCLELCTLHMQLDDRPDSVLANALFADGAAAGLVCGRLLAGGWALEGFATRVLPASGGAMAWGVGDHGFDLVLSSYVPDLLAAGIRELLVGALEGQGWGLDGVEHWAVHPGGRMILDKVEKALDLGAGALGASREVLASYGNMSSPTILFVLAALAREMANSSGSGSCAGLAFGPGLTVEMGFWRWLG